MLPSTIFLTLFLLTWALCFLAQIKIHLPDGKFLSMKILYTDGASFLCFCFLKCAMEAAESDPTWQGIAVHEFVHQRQQRWFSPLVFGLLYFGEWLFRKFVLGQSWITAYACLTWERPAEKKDSPSSKALGINCAILKGEMQLTHDRHPIFLPFHSLQSRLPRAADYDWQGPRRT